MVCRLTARSTFLACLVLLAAAASCKKEPAPTEGAAAPAPTEKAAAEPAPKRYTSHYGRFKVGDFVKLKGASDTVQTREVTKVDDKLVHVTSTTVHKGQTLPGSTTPYERYQDVAPTPAGGGTRVGSETLTIAGKQVPCEVWELKRGNMVVKTWRSERLLGGVAKVLTDDGSGPKVTSEVVDFKTSE